MSSPGTQNWVFLGDSITEGMGSLRFSYVTEIARLINARAAKNDAVVFRLRWQSADILSRRVMFNCLANCEVAAEDQPGRWLWNLASEGQMIDSDFAWLPLLANLRPEKIFVMRGGLENILRPESYVAHTQPFWIPSSWRGYASLDPRCYYSNTWWRRAKQQLVDRLKQRIRHRLLKTQPVRSLMDPDVFASKLDRLCSAAAACTSELVLLGLVPVSDETFPGSRSRFAMVDDIIAQTAKKHMGRYIDLKETLEQPSNASVDAGFFYQDGFHPTLAGARQIASKILGEIGDA